MSATQVSFLDTLATFTSLHDSPIKYVLN